MLIIEITSTNFVWTKYSKDRSFHLKINTVVHPFQKIWVHPQSHA